MDIEQDGSPSEAPGTQIVLPEQSLPGLLPLLPLDQRPFFPGQAMPVVLPKALAAPLVEALKAEQSDLLGAVAMRPGAEEARGRDDLYEIGTVCRVHRVHQAEEAVQLMLEGLQRFRIRRIESKRGLLIAAVQHLPDPSRASGSEQSAYALAIINTIKELIPLNPLYGEELKVFLARFNPNQPAVLADFAAALTSAPRDELQQVLAALDLDVRLPMVVELLHKEVKIAAAQMEIRRHVEQEIESHQREAVLRQQLKYIQKELGLEKDDKTAELERLRERAASLVFPDAVQIRFDEEIGKLGMLEPGSPEWGVTRNYLDWLTSVPWGITSEDSDSLDAARAALDAHHEGLQDVKDRIAEFLAVGISTGDASGSIICLVGPPGVGKTSLGKSVAAALNRKFFRFSVGGMRDEAEIKGHRRTYIGAMPGKLIRALKDTQTANPVIMLDEVDKIGASFQGDPASALLEVLDPEQNASFRDHYLDVDVDLSQVLFICTANQLDTIPAPLLDRMEVIHLAGYLADEKLAIARKHLLPRQRKAMGLKQRGDVTVRAAALKHLIDGYSREAGVRQLEKHLSRTLRKALVELMEGAERPLVIDKATVERYLGAPIYRRERLQRGVGVVTGLAWTAAGGATLPVEATYVHENGAGLKLTGQLGGVMNESANIAMSFVRANAERLGMDADAFDKRFVHLHVPAGATPKDGPSAGITMATALISLARGKAPRSGLAMTGELTLTGQVYPVGGIREKLLAAKRQGLKRVILPADNRRDVDEVPERIKQGIEVLFAETFDDVVAAAFG